MLECVQFILFSESKILAHGWDFLGRTSNYCSFSSRFLPTLFLIFINNNLSITQNPIHVGDSTLHHSFSLHNQFTLTMDQNVDLNSVLEWGKSKFGFV